MECLLLLAVGWIVAVPMVVLGQGNAATLSTPAPVNGSANAAAFEVISVRPNKSNATPERMQFAADGFTATNAVVLEMITYAYDLRDPSLLGGTSKISGAPGWVDAARYDVRAKMSGADAAAFGKLNTTQQEARMRLMFQALLADRFQLRIHRKTREVPAFALVIAKSGQKNMTRVADDAPSTLDWSGRKSLTAHAFGISEFADPILKAQLGRLVLDRTGLTGKYDFKLTWAQDIGGAPGSDAGGAGSPDTSGPSIFTAVQQQLGLRLMPIKAPIESIVVDHIEQPSEN